MPDTARGAPAGSAVETHCPYCSLQCGMRLAGRRTLEVRPWEEFEVNEGGLCRKGWTATVRPPASFTNQLKAKQILAWRLPGPPSGYEEDHLIALELGGNPTDERNLWPEPWTGAAGAHSKDAEENALNKAVCNGRMTLAAAQARIVKEWAV